MLYNKSEVDAGAWLHPRCLDGRWELVRDGSMDGFMKFLAQVQSAAREAAQALEKANAQLKKEARGERMTW